MTLQQHVDDMWELDEPADELELQAFDVVGLGEQSSARDAFLEECLAALDHVGLK